MPTGHFSPYTQAVLATLAGAYRLSKRRIQQLTADLLGLTISTGMISKLEKQSAAALAEPYHELARSVLGAEAVNIDETGRREDRRKARLWVTVTALVTVFTIGQPVRTLMRWFPDRTFIITGDGNYATHELAELAARYPRRLTLVSLF